jgi:hypothetical protein
LKGDYDAASQAMVSHDTWDTGGTRMLKNPENPEVKQNSKYLDLIVVVGCTLR